MKYTKDKVMDMVDDLTRHVSNLDEMDEGEEYLVVENINMFKEFISDLYDFQDLSDINERMPGLLNVIDRLEKISKDSGKFTFDSFITGKT